MKKILIILSILFCAVSCTHFSPEIEAVLQQAGDNRGELEKVLTYYHRPADSLKLRAAEFLITNMPGKYSEYYDAPWEDIATVSHLLTYFPDRKNLPDNYHLGTPVVREDLHYITAEYLINNIEMAFRSWQAAPWGKQVTFDTFCEEILPYRIADEPLENWREQALASFSDVYLNLLDSADVTAVQACSKVNDKLPSFIYSRHFPSMSYRQLMASTRGRHEHQATLTAFVMRAMGIPVTWEVMLQPSLNNRCAWNVVSDSTGRHIPFVAVEQSPGSWIPSDDWVMSNVLRHTFRRQAHSAYIPFDIPHSLDNFIDVMHEYGITTDIDVAILPETVTSARPPEYACLCVPGSSSEWMPVYWGKYHNGTYRFTLPGANMLYLPVIYQNGKQTSFNEPFFLTDEGRMIRFEQYKQSSAGRLAVYPRWHDVRYKPENMKTIDDLTGRWLFEDTTNYGKAAFGKDMTAYRMADDHCKGKPSSAGLKQVEGPNTGKKAVRVPLHSYFKCMHGVPHNGEGKNINEYTILIDFMMPTKSGYCFFQTNIDNADNVDMYLHPSMFRFGISQFNCDVDPPLRENEWYRLVVSAHLGHSLKYYLNGELIFANYNTQLGMLDSRLSWAKEGVLLFADDVGGDSDMDVSEVVIFGRVLADEEVFVLGGAGNDKWNTSTTKNK
jgi:hypothetical protein